MFGESGDDKSENSQKQVEEKKQEAIVESGIPGFDSSLGQGLPSGSLYLLSGHVGSNQDLFAQQILYHTIVSKGKVAYYTVEQTANDIIENMKLFGMNIQDYVDEGSWVFARALPPNMKVVMEALPDFPMAQTIELSNSLSALMKHFHEKVKDGCNTVIHLSHLIRNFSLEEIQNLLLFMTGVAREFGGIHLILITEDAHDQSDVITIKDTVDTVFEIKSELRGTELEHNITIKKMRSMIPKTRLLRFSVKKEGFITETIRRVK